jgi:Zn ribbon nucleic-acid-binding protein
VTEDHEQTCPGCEAVVDEAGVREQGGVERFGCLACGLQLVRRAGGRWESIRG